MSNVIAARRPEHPIHAQFHSRWSPRAFAPEPVPEAALLTMVEAARWAPSSMNAQPWRFVYASCDDDAFVGFTEALVTFNARWAAQAGALVFVAVATTFVNERCETRALSDPSFDAGMATMNFMLQAHALGYAVHAMGGFDAERAAAALALPDGYRLVVAMAVGKPGDPEKLPDDLREREAPSDRRPLAEIALRGSFAPGH